MSENYQKSKNHKVISKTKLNTNKYELSYNNVLKTKIMSINSSLNSIKTAFFKYYNISK